MLLSNDQNEISEVEEEQAIKKSDMTSCVDLKRDVFVAWAVVWAVSSEKGGALVVYDVI